jgi:hypothetical protein
MIRGVASVAVLVVLVSSAAAQSSTPQLSRTERDTLRQIVAAVDASSGEPDTPNLTWHIHRLRASDGSHYVAFLVESPTHAEDAGHPVMLYVRLASAALVGRGVERSAVADWLAGRRSDPMLRPRTGIAIGEMPNFGAAGLMDPNKPGRAAPIASGSNDLRLMQLEREREQREQEERERKRRAEMEGAARAPRDLLPFEDFDPAARADAKSGAWQRALTAGPGEYELYVAWSDPSAKPPGAVHVLKKAITLPAASALELSISDVIVADQVAVRSAAYPPAQQAAHPYAIGLTDITPAKDTIFSRDDRLNVAFQVINARPSEIGKPDIHITFRIVRVVEDREQPVASLTPQQYTADTLPANFDLRLGHPIFAAMSVPLATLARGQYRLKIAVNDRLSGRGTAGDADFSIVGTPTSLLSEAPPVGRPFRREMALEPAIIEEVASRLRPATPSSALSRALDTLRQRKFIDLMREEQFGTRELGYRAALTAIALYALGDPSAFAQFQRAMLLDVPPAAPQFFVGAIRAMEGRETDAAAAWQSAIEDGMPAAMVTPLLLNSHLRRGDVTRAAELMDHNRDDGDWLRERVAVQIASNRASDAIPELERRVAAAPGDTDAQWLLVHALYASLVRNESPDPAATDKFRRAAQAYIAGNGPNSALAADWLKAVRQ